MVNLRGTLRAPPTHKFRLSPRFYDTSKSSPPTDPSTLLSTSHLDTQVTKLFQWFQQFQSPDKQKSNNSSSNVLVITGAGLSTDSGIPDYRGHNGSYQKGHQPMIHDEFMRSPSSRQRYWGRSMAGYSFFASRTPNPGHYALTQLEAMGHIGVTLNTNHSNDKLSIITQNVDSLHSEAGTQHVMELHGRGKRLVCMNCGSYHCRHEFHQHLIDINSEWYQQHIGRGTSDNNNNDALSQHRPDGDANLSEDTNFSSLDIPSCPNCQVGILKPHVVFFGDTVPKHHVEQCFAAVDAADGLLCIGTSLEVHSAYRFVKAAAKRQIPIGILNVGETRAEREAHLFEYNDGNNNFQMNRGDSESSSLLTKIESPVGKTLEMVVQRILDNDTEQNPNKDEDELGRGLVG